MAIYIPHIGTYTRIYRGFRTLLKSLLSLLTRERGRLTCEKKQSNKN
nr:MAG TPA: hypothetical protein [Caudoviricetes sp.]DAM30557.1 MAG TPA: hypothetical protein [Caudoviricetes sp.]